MYDHPPLARFFGPDEPVTIPGGSGLGMGGGTQTQTQQQKQRQPKEDENNLLSLSFGRIMDLVSEGPIVGLCTRAGVPITNHKFLGMGVYLNGTPMISATGKVNFAGVSVGQKFGYQNQSPMDGFHGAEETLSISQEVKYGIANAVTVAIASSDTTSLVVAIRIPTLFEQVKETGDVIGSVVRVDFAVSLRGGIFVNKGSLVVSGKTQNNFIKEFALPLPRSNDPDGDFWDIRVIRVTPDSTTISKQNSTFVEYITRAVDAKLRYSLSAHVGIQFNAQAFPSMPERAYSMKGRIIKVPSNYYPATRLYTRDSVTGDNTGTEQPWDGTFRSAWTDNPAWVFYDLATNERYGLGEFLEGIDKWTLYAIGQYCDGKVRNPVNGRLEPRFTANIFLQDRQEAVKVMTDAASIFRGMTYWANGSIIAIQDAPKDPVALFTNANVKDGRFAYTGTARRGRHTIAVVRWNDPKDFYAPKFEYVPDADGVARYGVRELELQAFGCTRRGQAIRFGKWALATELLQTRLVTFSTGLEGAFPRPGDIIEVQDQDLAGVRHGGRILAIATDRKSVVVDKAIEIDADDYRLTMVSPQAFTPPGDDIPDSTYVSGIRASQLIHRELTNAEDATPTDTLTFDEAIPEGVVRGSLWSLSSVSVAVQLFRVLGVEERGSHEYEISAAEHNPGKFAAIENNLRLESPVVTRIPDLGNISPVTELASSKGYTDAPEGLTLWIQLTWKAPYDTTLRSFIVDWRRDGGNWDIAGEVTANAFKFTYTEKGLYEFRVSAVNILGVRSTAVAITVDIPATNPLPALKVNGLELVGADGDGQGNDFLFEGPDAKFRWRAYSTLRAYEFGSEPLGASIGLDDPYFHHYNVRAFDPTTGSKVWEEVAKVPNYTFTREHNAEAFGGLPKNRFRLEVTVVDKYNVESDAAVLIVENPAPAAPSGLIVDAAFQNVFLQWTNPPDRDVALIRIRFTIDDATFGHATILAEVPAGTTAWAHTGVTTGAVYRYWLEALDTFGNLSSPSGSATGTPGTIAAADIGAFAVEVTHIFQNTVALKSDLWSNNSPAAGRIAWNAHILVFRGQAFAIAAGNTPTTADIYVWWRGPVITAGVITTAGENAYRTSATHPKDAGLMLENDFIIATNTDGAVDLAWRALANAVIGSAFIKDAAVTNAKIASLSADKITAGTITSQDIVLAGAATLGAAVTITANAGTDTLTTAAAHGLTDGQEVQVLSTGALPAPLAALTSYYVRDVTSLTFKLATARGAAAINLTDTGSGTVTFKPMSRSAIRSNTFTRGASGWEINGDGTAEFNDVTVRGTLDATTLYNNSRVANKLYPLNSIRRVVMDSLALDTYDCAVGGGSPQAFINLGGSWTGTAITGGTASSPNVIPFYGPAFYGVGLDDTTLGLTGERRRLGSSTEALTFVFWATGTCQAGHDVYVAFRVVPNSIAGTSEYLNGTASSGRPWLLTDQNSAVNTTGNLPLVGSLAIAVPQDYRIQFALFPANSAASMSSSGDVLTKPSLVVMALNP